MDRILWAAPPSYPSSPESLRDSRTNWWPNILYEKKKRFFFSRGFSRDWEESGFLLRCWGEIGYPWSWRSGAGRGWEFQWFPSLCWILQLMREEEGFSWGSRVEGRELILGVKPTDLLLERCLMKENYRVSQYNFPFFGLTKKNIL